LLAYTLAPFAAWLGPDGLLVNAAPMALSLVNVALLWSLLRDRARPFAAVGATALYALAPAVMYQSFLANGGGFAFLFGMIGLHAFMRLGPEGRPSLVWGFVLGVSCVLGYYAMDYAALYPAVYLALFAARWRGFFRSKALAACLAGCAAGFAPVLTYNLTHDWAHLGQMLSAGPGRLRPVPVRALDALVDFFVRDGAALFTTSLDDFRPRVPPGAKAHFVAFIAACATVASWRREDKRQRAIETVALTAVGVYLLMYACAAFSAPFRRTPRYFIPLYPFAAVLIGCALERVSSLRRRGSAAAAVCLGLCLVAQSLWQDFRMTDSAHFEHRILTSGPAIGQAGRWLEAHGLRRVLTPYEIQMRLIAATNERVLASCLMGKRFSLSILPRYPEYDVGVAREVVETDVPFACVFRRDFAFCGLYPKKKCMPFCRSTCTAPRAG
jgi:hypothetical protein